MVHLMARKTFYRQFKVATVKLILEEGYSVKEVSMELEVHADSLFRCVNEYEQYGEDAFPGNGSTLFNAQLEIRKLKKENEILKEELGLLKNFWNFLNKKKP